MQKRGREWKLNADKLAAVLGIIFQKPDILTEALTHRSYLNESTDSPHSNERLEFLGDAILSFVVSQYLFHTFPDLPEGELTNLRSATVKTTTLALIAKKLGLGEYLRLSRGEEDSGGRQNISLLADTFEAVIGAIFLDSGIDIVKKFLAKHLFPVLPEIIKTRAYVDFKSELQERVQEKYRIAPLYKVAKEEGPDHSKTFYVVVYVNDQEAGSGVGKSKQEAEQEAARAALEKWKKS